MDEHFYNESDDERLVREALLAAFPPERSEFSLRRGQQIIRAAATEQLTHRPVVGSRVAAIAAASFTLLAGTAGAAGAALPGQPLYPLKRIVERAMVAMTSDTGDAARLELEYAQRRLDEALITTEAPVVDGLTRDFTEHVNAANALGGDEVNDEVERLEERHADRQAAAQLDVQPSPAPQQPPAQAPVAAASPSASPAPTASPSPTPAPSPSPSAGAPGDGPGTEPRSPDDPSTSPVLPPAGGPGTYLPDMSELPVEQLTPSEQISVTPRP